jgi:ribosome maturation factor RimP
VIAAGAHDRTASPRETAIARVISPALDALSVRLEDVLVKEGTPPILQILVDDAEVTTSSLTIDRVADASRAISDALDTSNAMGADPYDLEVSTPGVSRPLTHRHHFLRNVGRLLKVKRRTGDPIEGRLLEVHNDGILLQADLPAKKGVTPKLAEPELIPFADINRAKVDVEFTAVDFDAEVEEA